jgi:hypothetical protein
MVMSVIPASRYNVSTRPLAYSEMKELLIWMEVNVLHEFTHPDGEMTDIETALTELSNTVRLVEFASGNWSITVVFSDFDEALFFKLAWV